MSFYTSSLWETPFFNTQPQRRRSGTNVLPYDHYDREAPRSPPSNSYPPFSSPLMSGHHPAPYATPYSPPYPSPPAHQPYSPPHVIRSGYPTNAPLPATNYSPESPYHQIKSPRNAHDWDAFGGARRQSISSPRGWEDHLGSAVPATEPKPTYGWNSPPGASAIQTLASSCYGIRVQSSHFGTTLVAHCRTIAGRYVESSLNLDLYLGNDSGRFRFGWQGFSRTASRIQLNGTILSALLQDPYYGSQEAQIDLNDFIQNHNGQLQTSSSEPQNYSSQPWTPNSSQEGSFVTMPPPSTVMFPTPFSQSPDAPAINPSPSSDMGFRMQQSPWRSSPEQILAPELSRRQSGDVPHPSPILMRSSKQSVFRQHSQNIPARKPPPAPLVSALSTSLPASTVPIPFENLASPASALSPISIGNFDFPISAFMKSPASNIYHSSPELVSSEIAPLHETGRLPSMSGISTSSEVLQAPEAPVYECDSPVATFGPVFEAVSPGPPTPTSLHKSGPSSPGPASSPSRPASPLLVPQNTATSNLLMPSFSSSPVGALSETCSPPDVPLLTPPVTPPSTVPLDTPVQVLTPPQSTPSNPSIPSNESNCVSPSISGTSTSHPSEPLDTTAPELSQLLSLPLTPESNFGGPSGEALHGPGSNSPTLLSSMVTEPPSRFSSCHSTSTLSSTSQVFALIIGINKYADPNIKDLSGAVADADDMESFLTETVGVPKDRIVNLRDEQATRSAIETGIRSLASNSNIEENDPILVYYAGHGAEITAPRGWPSSDGKIQMLLPYDFASGGTDDLSRGQGVLDITLSRLLQELANKKGDNISIVLDSCHSGSGTRNSQTDPSVSVRGVELPPAYTVPPSALNDLGSGTRTSVIPKGFEKAGLLSHVLLAACSKGQTAKERQGRGDFTKELLTTLREEGIGELSYQELVERVGEKLSEQHPQCEGENKARTVFNSKAARRRPTLHPIKMTNTGYFILEAGQAHGVGLDAEFAVYADVNMKTFIGHLKATEPGEFTTVMSLADDQPPFKLSERSFALQTTVGKGEEVRLLANLGPDENSILAQVGAKLHEIYAGEDRLNIITGEEDRPHLVMTSKNGVAEFETRNPICRKHGFINLPFNEVRIGVETLTPILYGATNFFWHLHRSGKKSGLTSKIQVSCRRLIESDDFNEDLEHTLIPDSTCDDLNINGEILIPPQEHHYGFQITNNSKVHLFVALFYFDMSDLSITSYYQPGTSAKGGADFSLRPGQSLPIGYGDSGVPPISFGLREGQNVDVGFLKLFVTTKFVNYSSIPQLSPFAGKEHRVGRMVLPKGKLMYDTALIPLVQKRPGSS